MSTLVVTALRVVCLAYLTATPPQGVLGRAAGEVEDASLAIVKQEIAEDIAALANASLGNGQHIIKSEIKLHVTQADENEKTRGNGQNIIKSGIASNETKADEKGKKKVGQVVVTVIGSIDPQAKPGFDTLDEKLALLSTPLGNMLAAGNHILKTSGRGGNNEGVAKAYEDWRSGDGKGGQKAVAVYPRKAAQPEPEPFDMQVFDTELKPDQRPLWKPLTGDAVRIDNRYTAKGTIEGPIYTGGENPVSPQAYDCMKNEIVSRELTLTDIVVALPGGGGVSSEVTTAVQEKEKPLICLLTPNNLQGPNGILNGMVLQACREMQEESPGKVDIITMADDDDEFVTIIWNTEKHPKGHNEEGHSAETVGPLKTMNPATMTRNTKGHMEAVGHLKRILQAALDFRVEQQHRSNLDGSAAVETPGTDATCNNEGTLDHGSSGTTIPENPAPSAKATQTKVGGICWACCPKHLKVGPGCYDRNGDNDEHKFCTACL